MKNNVIEKYDEKITEIVTAEELPEIEERGKIIDNLNEEFFQETGYNLPPQLLGRLTDWYLWETLRDRGVDKVANSEFAILSPRQIKRRTKRETVVMDNVLDYLDLKYVKKQDSLAKVNTREIEQ